MNKKSICVLLATGLSSAAAMAQQATIPTSGVTISGLLDAGVIYNSTPNGSLFKVDRGNNNRLIFSGIEDLGNGNAATFALQHRFEPANGGVEGGVRPFWQGESRVGLRSNDYGWIRMGRGLTAVQDPNGRYEPFGVATVANTQDQLTAYYVAEEDLTKPANLSAKQSAVPGGEGRWSSAVFYDSPNMAGVVARVSVQPRTGSAVPISTSLTYDNGPISLMAGYEQNNRKTKNIQVAGTYDINGTKIMGSWATNNPVGPLKINGYGLGVNVPISAFVLRAGAAVARSNAATFSSRKLGVGGMYNLSKRTYLYSDIARGNTLTSAYNVWATDLGIAHKF